jgi:hypothetical protein
MKNLITYVKNLDDFRSEGRAVLLNKDHPANHLFSDDIDGGVIFSVLKTPVVKHIGGGTLSLLRGVSESDISNLSTIEVLGWEDPYGEFQFNEGGREVYESVHDVSTISTVIDGEICYYTPPYKIGSFS